ncbi:hypothetical protein [Archaeoglobus sp.]
MRWLAFAIVLILVISPAFAAEVNIFIDKESVNLGDQIRFQVYLDVNRSVDIAVVGENDGELLCHVDEGEDIYEKCGEEWTFTIPEDWDEGTYHLKVVIDDTEPEEHVEDFKVIRPKITEFELKELVYQSRTELEVLVESANPAKLKLRFYGNNAELYYEKTADFEEQENIYSAKFDLNLREMYERTGDIADTIKPGEYVVDLKLEYGGKVWDSKRISVSIVEPEFEFSAPDKIEAGEPLTVSISSNRIGEAEYDGILVVLAGKNSVMYKKAYLDEDGKAKVQFETAGLEAGKYTVYVRDTSKTSTLSISDLAKNYYDLPPDNSFSRMIQADDDILQKKDVWIVKEEEKSVKMYVQPSKAEIFNGTNLTFKILIDEEMKLSSYDFTLFISGKCVKIESVKMPDEFKPLEKSLHPDYLKISAYSMDKPSTSLLAEVKVRAQQPGECWLRVKNAGIYDGSGDYVAVTTNDAYVVVIEGEEENSTINVNISASESVSANTTITPTEIITTVTTEKTPETSSSNPTQPVSMNVGEIDYTKVFMFTAGFLATYTAGKVLSRRLFSKGGKR